MPSAALPLLYVAARVTRILLWLLMGTRLRLFSAEHLRNRRTFVPVSVSQWNDLNDPVFDGVGLAGFKSRAGAFLLA